MPPERKPRRPAPRDLDDDEDEAPVRRPRRPDPDDEEDERPVRKVRRPDPDDDDDVPVRKARRPEPVGDDDEPAPKSRRRDDDDDDEAPRKKKKKKKKHQGPSPWPKIALYGGMGLLGVLLVVGVIWMIVAISRGAPPAQPVTQFVKFSTDGNEWGFEHPAGWKASCYGLPGKREAEIKGPAATITVKENIGGSLVGDVARAFDRGEEVPDEFSPVAKVHDMRKPKKDDLPNYKEEPAVTVMTKFGKARASVYTDGSRKGYRATILMNQTALDIFCDCRASDWDALKPAFERVISTMGTGG